MERGALVDIPNVRDGCVDGTNTYRPRAKKVNFQPATPTRIHALSLESFALPMYDGGVGSPRAETPEPESRQGRRNARPGPQLLDDEGCISKQVRPTFLNATPSTNPHAQLELCLKHIFAKV